MVTLVIGAFLWLCTEKEDPGPSKAHPSKAHPGPPNMGLSKKLRNVLQHVSTPVYPHGSIGLATWANSTQPNQKLNPTSEIERIRIPYTSKSVLYTNRSTLGKPLKRSVPAVTPSRPRGPTGVPGPGRAGSACAAGRGGGETGCAERRWEIPTAKASCYY